MDIPRPKYSSELGISGDFKVDQFKKNTYNKPLLASFAIAGAIGIGILGYSLNSFKSNIKSLYQTEKNQIERTYNLDVDGDGIKDKITYDGKNWNISPETISNLLVNYGLDRKENNRNIGTPSEVISFFEYVKEHSKVNFEKNFFKGLEKRLKELESKPYPK